MADAGGESVSSLIDKEGAATDSAATDSAVPGRALVVDDMGTVRLVLSRYLKELGYLVTPARDGREALELLRGAPEPFDIVLLDVMMPEMDGYQTLTEIRGDPQLQSLPVVMISGLEEMESVARCIELGADDYLMKPFDPTLLRVRVQSCLEKSGLRREVAAQSLQIQMLEARLEASGS